MKKICLEVSTKENDVIPAKAGIQKRKGTGCPTKNFGHDVKESIFQ